MSKRSKGAIDKLRAEAERLGVSLSDETRVSWLPRVRCTEAARARAIERAKAEKLTLAEFIRRQVAR
jgi:hypothetical protein